MFYNLRSFCVFVIHYLFAGTFFAPFAAKKGRFRMLSIKQKISANQFNQLHLRANSLTEVLLEPINRQLYVLLR
jgi:hypothetical protein